MRLAGWLAGWLLELRPGNLSCAWLAGWLAGWLGGWLAGSACCHCSLFSPSPSCIVFCKELVAPKYLPNAAVCDWCLLCMCVYVCMYPIRFFRWAPNPEKRHPKGSWSPQGRKWPVLLATQILESRFFEGHHVCIRVWRLHLVESWFRIVTLFSLVTSSFTSMTAKMLMYPAIAEKILIPLCLCKPRTDDCCGKRVYVCM